MITLQNNFQPLRNTLGLGLLKHTFTRGATLLRSHDRVRTAGHGAGYEHAHLPSGVAVAVTAAIVPAVAFLISVAVRREAVAGHRAGDSGARNMAAFWRYVRRRR